MGKILKAALKNLPYRPVGFSGRPADAWCERPIPGRAGDSWSTDNGRRGRRYNGPRSDLLGNLAWDCSRMLSGCKMAFVAQQWARPERRNQRRWELYETPVFVTGVSY